MSDSELVDIVDERDRVVGRTTRAEMRIRRLLHRAVYVLVLDSTRRIFVHQRTATKDVYPGRWDVTIGGVVAAGETYPAAAERELGEELGLTGATLAPLGPVHYEDEATRVYGAAFLVVHDGPVVLQVEEIVEGRFMSLAEAERLVAGGQCCPDGVAVFRRYQASASSD